MEELCNTDMPQATVKTGAMQKAGRLEMLCNVLVSCSKVRRSELDFERFAIKKNVETVSREVCSDETRPERWHALVCNNIFREDSGRPADVVERNLRRALQIQDAAGCSPKSSQKARYLARRLKDAALTFV